MAAAVRVARSRERPVAEVRGADETWRSGLRDRAGEPLAVRDKSFLCHHRGDELGGGDVEGEVERLCARPGGPGGDFLLRAPLQRDRRAGWGAPVKGRPWRGDQ